MPPPGPSWRVGYGAVQLALTAMQEQQKRYPDGLPQLDPVEDMNLNDEGLVEAVRKIEQLEKRLCANEFFRVGPLVSCS